MTTAIITSDETLQYINVNYTMHAEKDWYYTKIETIIKDYDLGCTATYRRNTPLPLKAVEQMNLLPVIVLTSRTEPDAPDGLFRDWIEIMFVRQDGDSAQLFSCNCQPICLTGSISDGMQMFCSTLYSGWGNDQYYTLQTWMDVRDNTPDMTLSESLRAAVRKHRHELFAQSTSDTIMQYLDRMLVDVLFEYYHFGHLFRMSNRDTN